MLKATLHRSVAAIARTETLDKIAKPASTAVKRLLGQGPAKDALSGTWLGHPLHPLLTDIPIGSFTSATVLDLLGGPKSHKAADRLVALGVLAAAPTAAAGAADWSDTYGEDQRIGTVHAIANGTGVSLYALSLIFRRRGDRSIGTLLGLAGMATMTAGGYLGGSLSYTRGVGVNNTFWQHPPSDWTAVLAATHLPDGEPRVADADGVPVLLYRNGGTVSCIANRCTHAGGPLGEGEVDGEACTVTCPWHQSVFRLDTGEVVHGPATAPQPAFEAREHGSKIEVRAIDG